MADAIYTDPEKRHDFVLLFDVTNGNPNGDPDAGNLPRVDPETMQGLVTDVCLKRKVRNWVEVTANGKNGMEIYVKHQGVLNREHRKAYDALGKTPSGAKQDRETVKDTRAWMCKTFYDIRMFGAVMTTQVNCGQVRGPVQMTFATSIDPITPLDMSITRVAVTQEAGQTSGEDESSKVSEMGRKAIVPYGLYKGFGFFSPHLAKDTGASRPDLEVFWQALMNMWDLDHSASRGVMACRGLYVFTHSNGLGNAPAHALFERVQVNKKQGIEAPRQFSDYTVTVPKDEELPNGVKLERLVG
jgi:CRISPR-associated protein Csd2